MKKISIVFVVVLLTLSACLCFGCKKEENEPLAWAEMPPNTNPNFKYFGYYHFSDAIDEVAAMGNANLTKVDIDYLDEIAHLAEKNFNILIMIRHVFFKGGETPADCEERWGKAKEDIAPYMDNIIGFYVDEPIWTGKTQEAFHYACQTVRRDFPDKRMVAMLMYDAVLQTGFILRNPPDTREYCKYCTDVGFDLYAPWNKEGFLQNIELLKKNVLIEGQSIWLSPKGFYVADRKKNVNWMFEDTKLPVGEDIKRWIKGAYEVAVADPLIVGFLTFVYGDEGSLKSYDYCLFQFFDEQSEFYDKEIRDLYIQIGKAVIANDKK